MSSVASGPITARGAGPGAQFPSSAAQPSVWAEISDWIALLKPRVMLLVVFTGMVGLLVAPGHLNPFLAATSVLCIAMGAGAAGAINMWYDRDIDAVMRRTANRPVPGGRISAEAALAFGVVLAILSVLVMLLAANPVAAAELAVSIAFYVFVYTVWLKRRTPQNIVIGGAAGAFPPLIGWAAVTGSTGVLPVLLCITVFFWTPPHFWALSLFAREDYRRANVPMLPVVAGLKATRWQIFLYSMFLVPLSLAPWALGLTGPVYGGAALLLGLGFAWHALRVLRDRQDGTGMSLTRDAPAKALFRFSIYYLFLLFTAVAVDRFFG
ncbi:MAG TPA: heme o synthase [Acetobacteraceae bacterium]|nr:heme o synthase [Acetobacteraceae bacterium]